MRLRWDIISACVAAALTIGVGAAHLPAAAPSGADEAAVTITNRPAIIEENAPAAQYTPSDLRGSFPELPPKRSTPRAPRRGPATRFAAMDLGASAG